MNNFKVGQIVKVNEEKVSDKNWHGVKLKIAEIDTRYNRFKAYYVSGGKPERFASYQGNSNKIISGNLNQIKKITENLTYRYLLDRMDRDIHGD